MVLYKTFAALAVSLILTLSFSSSAFSMNKAELIEAIASDSGLSKADAKRALDAITGAVASIYQEVGETDFGDLGRITAPDARPRSFLHRGHVTVLKARDTETISDGYVSVSELPDGSLEMRVARFPPVPSSDGRNHEPCLDDNGDIEPPLRITITRNPSGRIAGTRVRRGGGQIFSSSLECGRRTYAGFMTLRRDGSYSGPATVLSERAAPADYKGHVTLLRSLAAGAYYDSFFDIISYWEARSIRQQFGPTDQRSHTRLYNSATYSRAFGKYIDKSTPLLMKYMSCVENGVDDDCNGIEEELRRAMEAIVDIMAEQTIIEPDHEGIDPRPRAGPEFDIKPIRIELSRMTGAALDAFLAQIAHELTHIVQQGVPAGVYWDRAIAMAARGLGSQGLDIPLDKVVETLNSKLTTALKKGDRVSLVGFGSFSVSNRAARTGRNPQTGKEIKIAAKNVVRFKAGAELSGKVN